MSRWSANQVIIKIPVGGQQAVDNLTEGLALKPGASFVIVPWLGDSAIPQIAALTANDRLYIVAHGSDDGTTAAGMAGDVLADELATVAGESKNVGLISLVICRAGREATTFFGRAKQFFNPTFAKSFHYALGKSHGTRTIVHARSENVSIFLPHQVSRPQDGGRKMLVYFEDAKDENKRTGVGWKSAGSKFKYEWVGGSQVVTQVYPDDSLGYKKKISN